MKKTNDTGKSLSNTEVDNSHNQPENQYAYDKPEDQHEMMDT